MNVTTGIMCSLLCKVYFGLTVNPIILMALYFGEIGQAFFAKIMDLKDGCSFSRLQEPV